MTSQNLASNWGSLESLKVRVRCGLRSLAAQIRYRRTRQPAVPSHGPATPTGPSLGRTYDFAEHCLNPFGRQRLGPSGSGGFLKTGQTHVQNTLTPQSHRHVTGTQSIGNLLVVFAFRSEQSNASPPDQLLGRARRLDKALKFCPLFRGKFERNLRSGHVEKTAWRAHVRKYLFETLH